jgi:uncharacterized protein (DUF697 family)
MNKKKLPKAIVRANEQLAAAGIASGAAEATEKRPADSNRPHGESAAQDAPAADNVVQLLPVAEPSSTRRDAAGTLPARPPITIDAERRRALAIAIVNRHAVYSAVGGIIPLPLINLAGVTTIIVRMVKVLSDQYGVPFERDRARAIVVGLVGGIMPTGAAAVATSALFYTLPHSALMGLAVSSVTAATFARGIGRIFVEHFESGATLDDFPASERR